jgi:hypothetical protein
LDSFFIHYADFLIQAPEFGASGELLLGQLVVPPNLKNLVLEPDRTEALQQQLRGHCAQMFQILASKPVKAPAEAERVLA